MVFDPKPRFVKSFRFKIPRRHVDSVINMCSTRNLAPTWALFLLLVACSKTGKGTAKDAGPHDGGMTIDTELTVLDAAKAADVRDLATSSEASVRMDVPSAIDTTKSGDTKDAASSSEANGSLDGGRDAADASKPVDTKDAAKDVSLGTDAKDALSAIDVYIPNSCTNPVEIPMDNPHIDLTVSTDGESHDYDLPCATGGNDIVLSFYLDRTEMVYADTFGTSWNTILAFSPTCPLTEPQAVDGMVTCNDDACGSTQSQTFAILPNGRYYLVLSGANGESGSATIHFQHAPVGTGSNLNLPEGSSSLTGTTGGFGALAACDAVGPEDCYWWTSCPDYAGGDFSASTCGGAAFDVTMSLQIPRIDATTCADGDSCGLQEVMTATLPAGAGMHVLAVDGNNRGDGGKYTLVYTRP
jgi:hypothetical protein